MRTNLGQAEDRRRTYEGPHRQTVQFYLSFYFRLIIWSSKVCVILFVPKTAVVSILPPNHTRSDLMGEFGKGELC